MKKLFISLTIITLLFAGCSGNQTTETDHTNGTHTHEDGTVHQDHDAGIEPDQEKFTVPSDTTTEMEHDHQEHEENKHAHDDHDHDHPHNH